MRGFRCSNSEDKSLSRGNSPLPADIGFALCSSRDYIGFVLGLASIVTWMVAQLPQVISNFKNKSAEALSAWFLAEWLMVIALSRLLTQQSNPHPENLQEWIFQAKRLFTFPFIQGDTCNLIGCLLTGDQLMTQTYTAV